MKPTPDETTTIAIKDSAMIRPINDKFNDELKAFGLAKIARGDAGIIIHEQRKDEWKAKLLAEYKRGRQDERREEKNRVTRRGNVPLGRPPKYPFSDLKVGDTITVDQQKSRRVYHAARQWAWRNAPSRKFSVQAVNDGTTITRTA